MCIRDRIKEASGNISQVAKIMHLTDGKADLYSGNDDQIVPILSLYLLQNGCSSAALNIT